MERAANHKILAAARESRGLTQSELAEKAAINQASISRYEAALMEPSEEHLAKLSTVLDYPVDLFFQPDCIAGPSPCTYYRKRKTMPIQKLRQLQATINILRIQITRLLEGVDIVAENRFSRMDVAEYDGSPEEVARAVRSSWNLPIGPVPHLISAIEHAGGLIVQFPFGTRMLDAASQWTVHNTPIFFVNADAPADRMRFTLAHELGHLFMHRSPTIDMEGESDRFAAEFLMPERDVAGELSGMSIAKAARLKPYWRASMWAIIRRARDTRQISEWKYERLCTSLSAQGHRVREPVEIAPEEPELLNRIVGAYIHDMSYTDAELSKVALAGESDLRSYYLPRVLSLRKAN